MPAMIRGIRLVFSLAVLAATQVHADALALQERLISLIGEHSSAIVRVKAIYPPEEKDGSPQVVIGSGFFISREGLILTNASIVSKPLRVWIEHNQVAYGADILGIDERSNLAFLRVRTLPSSFSFLHLSDRADLPPIGYMLIKLSMPLEFEASPALGMVSGYESGFGDRYFPCKYIRAGIPAGPGDGGAAFLDLNGRLIGIQVGSLPDIQSSYILPARAALRIRDDILFSGTVTYGWIGFEVEMRSSVESGARIYLQEILPDSPASQSGLAVDDQLLRIGDFAVRTLDDLRNAMFYARVGQYVDVLISRAGEERRFTVKVASRPADEPMEFAPPQETPPMVLPLRDGAGTGEAAAPEGFPFHEDLKGDNAADDPSP
jgi:S1-C subfamily serine protease